MTARQPDEAEFSMKELVRVLAIPGASLLPPPHQPSALPPLSVVLDGTVFPEHGALVEVSGPTPQLLVDNARPHLGFRGVPLSGGFFMDGPQQFLERFLRGSGPDIRLASFPVETANGVAKEVERLPGHTHQPCFAFVHFESQLLHDPRHRLEGHRRLAGFAADHKVIGIVHDL